MKGEMTGRITMNQYEKCGCGHTKDWQRDCWNCGGSGFTEHDCGEDCCCCLYPEDNVECDICEGVGFYLVCPLCVGDD